MSVTDYSKTALSNTSIDSTDISEGCSPAGINNAIRSVMKDIAEVVDGTTAMTAFAVDNLKLDGNTLSSTDTNGDITLDPNGTGNVVIGNYEFDADQTVGAGQDNYVMTYDNATGHVSLEAATSSGAYDLNGGALTLDADGDTKIVADTDDRIDVEIGGSDRVRINSSGQIITDGEGGSNLTVDLRQGAAKVWAHYNANGTASISDSLNTSSITDLGTGDMSIAHNNDMNNANYSATVSSRNSVNNDVYVSAIKSYATSGTRTVHNNSSGGVLYANSRLDHTDIGLTIHGDLA